MDGPGPGGRGARGARRCRFGSGPVRAYGGWGLARGIALWQRPSVAGWSAGDVAARVHGGAREPGAGRGGDQGGGGQFVFAAAPRPGGGVPLLRGDARPDRRPCAGRHAFSVLVLAGCGPAGMAMPEWGNIPIPAKLLSQGVTDMLRITDGRMSGTGFGTVVLHVAPESAVGGPLSRLRDGDMVSFDAYAGALSVVADLDASRASVARRCTTGGAGRCCTGCTSCRRPRAATTTSCGPRRLRSLSF